MLCLDPPNSDITPVIDMGNTDNISAYIWGGESSTTNTGHELMRLGCAEVNGRPVLRW